jgi:hypothetical protein
MDHISLVTELLAAGETFCLATVTASSRPEASVGLKALIRSGGGPGSPPSAGRPARRAAGTGAGGHEG